VTENDTQEDSGSSPSRHVLAVRVHGAALDPRTVTGDDLLVAADHIEEEQVVPARHKQSVVVHRKRVVAPGQIEAVNTVS
jgi:hypothetical protein